MNTSIFIAAILCFLLGIVHSVLGELLIFKSKRKKGSLIPSIESTELKERHLRIIWATWHLTSIFGWCIGAMLMIIAFEQHSDMFSLLLLVSTYSMFISSLLVFIGTKGKHPGWIVLLLIGILLFVGN